MTTGGGGVTRAAVLSAALMAFLVIGSAAAQARLSKTGVAGSSTIRVQCGDALSGRWPDEVADLTRRFRSNIIVRCVATAASGSGVINPSDFSWRYKYSSNTTVYSFSNSSASGSWGEVFGSVEREFYLGLPQTQRPEVIVLMLDGHEATITFVSNP